MSLKTGAHMARPRSLFLLCALLIIAGIEASGQEPQRTEPVRGIIFDPTNYYARKLAPEDMAARLTADWQRHGVNVVYVNAYNVAYGAHYRTSHRFNDTDSLGKADFLTILIREAHRRRIKVFAAFYHHVHKGAWRANPDWRAKRQDGRDYTPRGVDVQYFLSIWHPDVPKWWLGLLEEVLVNYPDLDGIELREPVISWWAADADYNPHAVRAFQQAHPGAPLGGAVWKRWRAEGLTALLKQGIRLAHQHKRAVHLTSVMSSWGSGQLLTAEEQAENTGFDLNGVLSGDDLPDAIKVELIWQQWGNVYDYATFTPAWTGRAVTSALSMVGGRTRTIVHVELTDFGQRRVSGEETFLAIRAARRAGATDFDVYGAKQADDKNAWIWLQRAFDAPQVAPAPEPRIGPARRLLVLEDDDPEATQIPRLATALLMNLLGHFDVITEVQPVSAYRPGDLTEFDAVIYQGTRWDVPLPVALLRDLDRYNGSVLWVGANFWQLTRGDSARIGMEQRVPVSRFSAAAISVAGKTLAAGPQALLLGVRPGASAKVLATARVGEEQIPIAATNGRVWYVGGFLYQMPDRSPLHLLVADLLHDVLRADHPRRRQALLFVTGVTPTTDPAQIRHLRETAIQFGIRPAVGITPVFIDPVLRTRVTLEDRPRLVSQLQALVRAGGDVVLAGYTHQLRGRTGADYEFWDAATGGARADDSPEMVLERVNAGLRELTASRLFPLAWSTPGGLASPFDYTLFGEIFSTHVERRFYGFAEGRPVQPRSPFLIERDFHGHTVLSPNVLLEPRGGIAAARADAQEYTVVRDALAVISVPIGTSPELLRPVLGEMRQMGYAFTHLRALRPIRIHGDTLAVISGDERVKLAIEGGVHLRELRLEMDGGVRTLSLRRVRAGDRYEFSAEPPADGLHVIEVLQMHPWAPEALAARTRAGIRGWLQSWEDARGLGRLGLILRGILTIVSAATLVALAFTVAAIPFLLLLGAVRRLRPRQAGHAP